MRRTVLVHLNIELPASEPWSAEDITAEVKAALEVAAEGEHAPALEVSSWCIPLAEEV